MAENELKYLKEKQAENMRSAYINILRTAEKGYSSEVEIILRYFGIQQRLESDGLKSQYNEIKNRFNIASRTVSLGANWYKNSMLPLLVRKNGSFKAVLSTHKGNCYYIENGRRKYITEKNAAEFDTKAVCFYKGFAEEKISRISLVRYMLSCIRPREYIVIFFAMTLATLFSTVMPQAQYYIFNNIIPAGTAKDIMPISLLLFGIIIMSLVINLFKGIVTANMPLTISANLQGAVLSRLLSLKPNFFTNAKSGRLSQVIIKISDVSDIISAETIAAFLSFVLSVIYAVEIKIYAGEFMGFVWLAFAVVLIMTGINAVLLRRYTSNFYDKANEMTGFVYEVFGGMENVKLSNSTSVMFNRWSRYYADTLQARQKPFFTKYYSAIYTFVITLFTAMIFVTGIKAETTAADFIAFMSLYGLFIASVGGIGQVLDSAANFNSAYAQLKDFFEAETEINDNKKEIQSISESIEFSNVSYKYPDSSEYTLKNIAFTLKRGEKLGITGKSGCGKSTLMRLLLGFEQPDKGRIFIDNTDLNEIDLTSYRRNLGVVLQSSKLIPADIYSNITLTSPDSTQEEVMKAVETVGLKEDIERMPMGLHTFLSEDNMTISIGQKQRILLARAILSKPSLLVFDEATNALDNITQAAVTKYITNSDTTAVIVAHRLSTVRQCDRIIVLDGGTIAEIGTYDELIKREGIFYELVKDQI